MEISSDLVRMSPPPPGRLRTRSRDVITEADCSPQEPWTHPCHGLCKDGLWQYQAELVCELAETLFYEKSVIYILKNLPPVTSVMRTKIF